MQIRKAKTSLLSLGLVAGLLVVIGAQVTQASPSNSVGGDPVCSTIIDQDATFYTYYNVQLATVTANSGVKATVTLNMTGNTADGRVIYAQIPLQPLQGPSLVSGVTDPVNHMVGQGIEYLSANTWSYPAGSANPGLPANLPFDPLHTIPILVDVTGARILIYEGSGQNPPYQIDPACHQTQSTGNTSSPQGGGTILPGHMYGLSQSTGTDTYFTFSLVPTVGQAGSQAPTPTQTDQASPTPSSTAQPQGPTLSVVAPVVNVRVGPGVVYGLLGQLPQGSTQPIIGVSADGTWVVINFVGQQGWVSVNPTLDSISGNTQGLPVIIPPPPPVIPPSATPTHSPTPDFTPTPTLSLTPTLSPTMTITGAIPTLHIIGTISINLTAIHLLLPTSTPHFIINLTAIHLLLPTATPH